MVPEVGALMIHLVLSAVLGLGPQAAPAGAEVTAADIEAAHMIERHAAEVLCVTQLRPENETVAACTDRRLAVMRSQPDFRPVSPTQARAARLRCETEGPRDGETLSACLARDDGVMVEDIFGSDIGAVADLDAAAPRPAPSPRACVRETAQSAEGTTSATAVCGNDEELAGQVRERLQPDR